MANRTASSASYQVTTAGHLSHRIVFERRAEVDDGYGNTTAGFEPQFTVHAAVRAKLGGEAVLAGRLTGQNLVNIVVRQSSQTELVGTDWRARNVRSGVVYAIRSIIDPDDSGAWFEMLCQTGVAA